MTSALLTPFDFSNATKVGRTRFRKQILPIRTIDYKGRKITFDRPFLQELVRNFKARAYDQVPFVLADGQNRHNESPENFRGSVRDLILTEDGLDAVLDLSKDGARLIESNPELGVSARIFENIVRNGRTMSKVLRHVCATMDPRVTGMRPWQAVDLSEDVGIEVVDLTAETYGGRNSNMPKSKLRVGSVDKKTRTATLDLSELSDDEFEAMFDLAEGTEEVVIDPKTGKPVATQPVEEPDEEEIDPEDVEEGDEDPDVENAVVPGTGEQPPATPPALKKRSTTVTEEAVDSGEMVASLSNEFATWRATEAKKAWKSRATELASAGVPPFLLDLAAPFMESPDSQVIELSNGGGSHDIKETLDKMLQGFTGVVDLTPEMGHSIDLSTEIGGKNDPDAALLKEWSDTYGD
jgi:hypothetical protein